MQKPTTIILLVAGLAVGALAVVVAVNVQAERGRVLEAWVQDTEGYMRSLGSDTVGAPSDHAPPPPPPPEVEQQIEASRPHEWRPLFLFAAMLVGIVFGEAYNRFLALSDKRRIAPWSELRRTFLTGRIWAGLFASPIIFAAIYSLCRNQPDVLLSGVFAFENGFFWNVVLKRRETAFGQTAPATEPATSVE
jgi:hypothetical protein